MPNVVVIGGGIAGVAAAAHLAGRTDVLLVEAEDQLAYHTTGRSAALFYRNYGSPASRPLTSASRAFLEDPPDGLTDGPLLSARGGLRIGRPDQARALEQAMDEGLGSGSGPEWIEPGEVERLCPAVRTELLLGGVWEPDATDLDVAGLHQAFVRQARRHDVDIRRRAPVHRIARIDGGWRVHHGDDHTDCDVIVNAAGAWGDVVAGMAGVEPIGLEPRRRTVFMTPAPADSEGWPMIIDADHDYYFKPDGEQLLCSSAEAEPSEPTDARPREIDIARAIEAINVATTLALTTVRSSWTGLRTFAPDDDPVHGFDPDHPGFFWLVGQGGTGIQTAPAAGAMTAQLIIDGSIGPDLAAHGIDPAALSPARFRP